MSSHPVGNRAPAGPQCHCGTEAAETPNDVIVAAIRRHHAQLAEQLRTRTRAVASSVLTGNYAPTRDALHRWYCMDLMPHIVAEEGALYGPAADVDATRLLIRSMLTEHEFLVSLIEDLALAPGPTEAASVAAAAEAVFTVHLRNENDILLPALAEAELDLGAMLAGMHEILGQSGTAAPEDDGGRGCSCGATDDDTGRQVGTDGRAEELDVRVLAHDARHEVIFDKLGRLEPGSSLVIVNDHDPKPLRYQAAARWPGRFGWSYLQAGPHQWRVAITRVR